MKYSVFIEFVYEEVISYSLMSEVMQKKICKKLNKLQENVSNKFLLKSRVENPKFQNRKIVEIVNLIIIFSKLNILNIFCNCPVIHSALVLLKIANRAI